MKKALGILLVVCLLMGTGLAETDDTVGSGVDLTVLTDEQVRKLQQEVKVALGARGLEGVVVPPGKYVVGTDISAGSYVFTGLDSSGWSPIIWVYADSQKFEEDDPIQVNFVTSSLRTGLEDGMILRILTAPCIVEKSEMLFFD